MTRPRMLPDLAVTPTADGARLADIALLPGPARVFGPMASDPTVSRLVAPLAADAPAG